MQSIRNRPLCHTSFPPTVRLPGIRDLFPELISDSPTATPSKYNPHSPPLLHIATCPPGPDGPTSEPGYSLQTSSSLSTPHVIQPYITNNASSNNSSSSNNNNTSKSRKHVCPECQKRFNRPSSLSIHLHTHTGERPYTCPHPGCQRTFNVSSNMRRHFRSHDTDNGSASQFSSFSLSPSPSPTSTCPPPPPYARHQSLPKPY